MLGEKERFVRKENGMRWTDRIAEGKKELLKKRKDEDQIKSNHRARRSSLYFKKAGVTVTAFACLLPPTARCTFSL